jgi:L-fuconolactonase
MTIDTHQHFWRYTPEEYGWISGEMAVIRRDYLPADLAVLLAKHGVDGVIAVEARQTIAETEWLLALAREHPFIRGVVGWMPLASPDIERLLDGHDPRLVGLRHVLQEEPMAFFAGAGFNRGLDVVAKRGLAYDLLVNEPQLGATLELVDRHPSLRLIVDHLAKPNLAAGPSAAWRGGIMELARRPNVMCKISGGITEIDFGWTPAQMAPYFDTVLEAFGPLRVMFGSNWPVSDTAGGYGPWIDAVRKWAAKLSPDEQSALFSQTAVRAYRLDGP